MAHLGLVEAHLDLVRILPFAFQTLLHCLVLLHLRPESCGLCLSFSVSSVLVMFSLSRIVCDAVLRDEFSVLPSSVLALLVLLALSGIIDPTAT